MEVKLRRFYQAVDYLRDSGKVHSQQDLADSLGLSKQNMSSAMKGDPKRFTMGFLRKFAAAYSDYINEQWLLTGEGDMEHKDPRLFKPDVPIRVAAGFLGGSVESALSDDCELLPRIPTLPDYDFTIRVVGESMSPILLPDDLLACKFVLSRDNLRVDKFYVLDTKDGAAVKKIRLDGENVVCSSINAEYPDYTAPFNTINKIAQVVGVLRQY